MRERNALDVGPQGTLANAVAVEVVLVLLNIVEGLFERAERGQLRRSPSLITPRSGLTLKIW